MRLRNVFLIVVTAFSWFNQESAGQQHVNISGLAYLDYYYTVDSPDSSQVGENGFTYRRLYLTTDFDISDRFRSRARLETKADDATPYVKDLYVQWRDVLGDGHHATFGVMSPPSYTVSEKVWDFRSLEKTIQDRVGVVSSRDMGLKFNGPVTSSGSIRYAAMVSNNNGVLEDNDKHKRAYAQLELYPADGVSLTVGSDYASGEDRSLINFSGFAGYSTDQYMVGVEAFSQQTNVDEVNGTFRFYGVSAFGHVILNEKWAAVGRVDHTDRETVGPDVASRYFIAALVFSPETNIRIMPNLIFAKTDGDSSGMITGRLTIEASL